MAEALLRHTPARCGLAVNPALPSDLLDQFVSSADTELCQDLAERNDLSLAHIRTLARRGGTATVVRLVQRGLLHAADVDASDPQVGLALLEAGTAPSLWKALAMHPEASVRAAVASIPGVPIEVSTAMVDDPVVDVVAEIARTARLDERLAWRLAHHPHMAVRRAVAANENAPAEVLAWLCDGGEPPAARCPGCDGDGQPPTGMDCRGDHASALVDLQYALAANPATPVAVAAALAEHPTGYVRWPLTRRCDLPQHVYQRLANDPLPGIRADVAANLAIGETLIRDLAADGTYDVRRGLAQNPAIPLDVLAEIASATKIGPTLLPRIASATPDEVAAMARSPVAALRMLVAERPDLPIEIVHTLAIDTDAKVLKAIAPNALLDDGQLRAMVAAHGPRVIARVARNPNCSSNLLQELSRFHPPVQKAFREIAAHPNATAPALLACLTDHQARRIAVQHPAMPAHAIAELLNDPDPHVAESSAASPHVPIKAMRMLMDSGQSATS